MTIQIQKPELEALIQQLMATGRFRDVEDFLLNAIKGTETMKTPDIELPSKSLVEIFAIAREILDGEELDLRRDPSPMRALNLS